MSEHLVMVWNHSVPVGTKVDVVEDNGTTTSTVVVSQAWMVGGQPVVSLGDRRAGFLLWRVTPVKITLVPVYKLGGGE